MFLLGAQVMDTFEARAKPGVRMSYRAVGSGAGQYEFIGKENTPKYATWDQDFGSGDIPITAKDYAELTDAGIEMMHVPFQIGAMSFFHNVPVRVPDSVTMLCNKTTVTSTTNEAKHQGRSQ